MREVSFLRYGMAEVFHISFQEKQNHRNPYPRVAAAILHFLGKQYVKQKSLLP